MKYLLFAIISLLFLSTCVKPDNTETKNIKLVIVGGGQLPASVKDRFIGMAGGINSNILIIPSASSLPDRAISAKEDFTNCTNLDIMDALSFQEANSPTCYNKIQKASALWFTGGDQKKLLNIYHNSRSEYEFKQLLNRGGVIGGTSAGASIMGKLMPYEGETLPGFAFTDLVIDQHFNTRNRYNRLQTIVKNSGLKGIGIDESTALIIDGNIIEVIGKGKVIEINN